MGLSILDLLLPREVSFFKHMNRQISIFHKGCKAFKALVSSIDRLDEDEIHRRVAGIKEFELMGDSIERFIVDELNKTFITPLDREDIHSIVTNVDNSLDLLNGISQKIEIYKIRNVPGNVVKFATIIVDISIELKMLISDLHRKRAIDFRVKKIHLLENEADSLFHNSIAELFSTKDIVEIIKFKEIYEHLEETVNSVDFIGELVRGIMVKEG